MKLTPRELKVELGILGNCSRIDIANEVMIELNNDGIPRKVTADDIEKALIELKDNSKRFPISDAIYGVMLGVLTKSLDKDLFGKNHDFNEQIAPRVAKYILVSLGLDEAEAKKLAGYPTA